MSDQIMDAVRAGRLEALEYAAEWIDYHRTVENRHPAYLSALGDMGMHVNAAIERVQHNEPLRLFSRLDTTEDAR